MILALAVALLVVSIFNLTMTLLRLRDLSKLERWLDEMERYD